MPLRLNVGLSRKVGEANYGSRGASVNVELEVDGSLIGDPDKLKERIRQLFSLVRSSLTEELNGNNHTHPPDQDRNAQNPSPPHRSAENGSRRTAVQPSNLSRPATQSQIKAIYAIAHSQHLDLVAFLLERFQVRQPADLTVPEASQVIDELKRAG
jgi:hypothetical protein